eukprot:CAMPEP_0114142230 /NCGR_PEP_ID=MMETSP0043_2-20121206/18339_1 /TAXON_ID=464988 /ORGANISM="Hemiselmis andersenii, Strain CCMP644" /LENGTH=91 /DNA_ID=CAMNT_0001236441 /DNA_START=56 /DNA_END=331 /DNA_ORIENTATION=-
MKQRGCSRINSNICWYRDTADDRKEVHEYSVTCHKKVACRAAHSSMSMPISTSRTSRAPSAASPSPPSASRKANGQTTWTTLPRLRRQSAR